MAKYKVAVLGCGAIFSRHLAALQANDHDYEFVGYYDPKPEIKQSLAEELPLQRAYNNEAEIYNDNQINCVVILTPSHLHYSQSKSAIQHGKSVIVEKPACFNTIQLEELATLAQQHHVNIFCVLQVRLNPSIAVVKQILNDKLLGDIRSSSLVQRWQRPVSYFSGWRGTYSGCGGVLNEFGIHYLDIMQYLLGMPNVASAQFFNTKFKDSEIADSAYALFDYGTYGATIEICLTAEPHNIEVSLLIMGSNGYVKLGGKSLDQIISIEFLDSSAKERYNQICHNILGYSIDNQVTIGACPHHPELYKQIIQNPKLFDIQQTNNVIKLISQINQLDK